MAIAFFIPPVSNSMAIDWENVNIHNYLRATIFIIGSLFLPGGCLFEFLFDEKKLKEKVGVESFFIKITLYPILSLIFIGVNVLIFDSMGLVRELFPATLFILITGFYIISLIIKYRKKKKIIPIYN
ncbi:MAG: hypothetical protein ACFFDN_31490 [Candidatus Hodarchaeota archaeon]